MKRKTLVIMTSIVLVAVGTVLLTSSIWPVISVVETGKTPEYATTLPFYYSTDPERVTTEAIEAAKALERMTITDRNGNRFEATMTSILPFMDAQLEVRISPVTEYVTVVNVRSETTVLPGDLGQNARNIRHFQQVLDARLGSVKFDPGSGDR